MEERVDFVRKGEDCLRLAKDVVEQTKSYTSKPEDIKAKLFLMKIDAILLDNEADKLTKRLNLEGSYCIL